MLLFKLPPPCCSLSLSTPSLPETTRETTAVANSLRLRNIKEARLRVELKLKILSYLYEAVVLAQRPGMASKKTALTIQPKIIGCSHFLHPPPTRFKSALDTSGVCIPSCRAYLQYMPQLVPAAQSHARCFDQLTFP